MKTVPQVAEELAKAHVAEDPQTTDVFYLDGVRDEVRLVEVSGSLRSGSPGEVLPLRFQPQPEQGIPYASVVVLLGPSEWQAVGRGELALPRGWDKANLKKVI